jgi:hypothetical protein
MKSRLNGLVLLALTSVAAFAAEAPWYKWVNQEDRTILCTQLPPGDAWVIYQGPFQDALCKKPGNPH